MEAVTGKGDVNVLVVVEQDSHRAFPQLNFCTFVKHGCEIVAQDLPLGARQAIVAHINPEVLVASRHIGMLDLAPNLVHLHVATERVLHGSNDDFISPTGGRARLLAAICRAVCNCLQAPICRSLRNFALPVSRPRCNPSRLPKRNIVRVVDLVCACRYRAVRRPKAQTGE
eukprot:scaffold26626_cov57-Phaeocystis_antarctica.AAC.1